MTAIKVTWVDGHKWPSHPPDPNCPEGIDVDLTKGLPISCQVELPYPAKRIGYYALKCSECGFSAIVTTMGRVDDPRSAKLPCRKKKG